MTTRTEYAVTYASKSAEIDNYTEGCVVGTDSFGEYSLRPRANTLRSLVRLIQKDLGIDPDKAPDNEVVIFCEDGEQFILRLCRHELGNGLAADNRDIEGWKQNKVMLWLVDYGFFIEKRIVSLPTPADLEGLNITEVYE